MEAIELLKTELKKWIISKEKSKIAFEKGNLSLEIHLKHDENLNALIKDYKEKIKIIEKNLVK